MNALLRCLLLFTSVFVCGLGSHSELHSGSPPFYSVNSALQGVLSHADSSWLQHSWSAGASWSRYSTAVSSWLWSWYPVTRIPAEYSVYVYSELGYKQFHSLCRWDQFEQCNLNTLFGTMAAHDLKLARSAKRSGLTRRLNNMKRLVAEDEASDVRLKFNEAKLSFKEFEASHDSFHATLVSDDDITNSDTYFDEVELNYTRDMLYVTQYLKSTSSKSTAVSQVSSQKPSYSTKLPPAPQPDTFTGKSETYPLWKASFNTLVDKHDIGYDEKMFYLKKYTGGEAQSAIEALFLCPDKSSYESALDILKTRFGSATMVTTAFRKRIEGWSKIGDKDSKGLRKFADFLTQVVVAKKSYSSLSILSDEFENRKLVKKLPPWLAAKWIELVVESDTFPDFDRFTKFIISKAEIANHTLWGSGSVNTNQGSSLNTDTSKHDSSKQPVSTHSDTCVVCQNNHKVTKCPTFIGMSLSDRKRAIMQHRMCFGCLSVGHRCSECRSKHTCAVCKKRHPTLLHDYNRVPTGAEHSEQQDASVTQSASALNTESRATTMVVPVLVGHPSSEKTIMVYALLDTQSNTHFVTQEVLDILGITGSETVLDLTTMNGRERTDSAVVQGLEIRGLGCPTTVTVGRTYTRNTIPCNRSSIPTNETITAWPHLSHLEVPPLYTDAPIGLLIGYTCPEALRPLDVIPGKENEPFALKTSLGWCIVGSSGVNSDCETGATHYVQGCIALRTYCKEIIVEPQEIVSDFDNDDKFSVEDLTFLKIMGTEMCQRDDKHYEAPLPLKYKPNLPSNRSAALKRLNGLKGKFGRDQSYHETYTKVMNETLESGFAEVVPQGKCQPFGRTWYIPHHGVSNKQKLRVVFDCSAEYQGCSLNDLLLQGPDLLNTLLGILLRFRTQAVAVTCDVQKMYHQFKVKEQDRDLLRFLWWPNGNTDKNPIDHRMTVHLFGATSSPGVATFALRKIATDFESKYPSEACDFVKKDFYVDDGVTSVESDIEAHDLIINTKGLLSEGGLKLHKIMSNSKELMELISDEDRAPEVIDHMHKTLGIMWDVKEDKLCIPLEVNTAKLTRRGMLSSVSSIYDPMGFAAPLLLQAKLILQQMCRDKRSWDDPLSSDVSEKYKQWYTRLNQVCTVQVPRCHRPNSEIKIMELHHFADASSFGYSACSYVRYIDVSGTAHVSLLLGKCKVVPIKPVLSVPRLELMSAVLCVQVASVVRRELQWTVKDYFWTDSTVVLGYIRNETLRFKVFVANRVQKIRSGSRPDQWSHVNGSDNPADDGSRGVFSERWLNGPEFLRQDVIVDNMRDDLSPEIDIDDAEVCMDIQVKDDPVFPILINWFGTKKLWAWMFRFAQNCRPGATKQCGPLSIQEIDEAEIYILRKVQSDNFASELARVKDGKCPLRDSKLHKLNIFLDNDGLLRVGGRVKHGSLAFQLKHPVILPENDVVSRLIVEHFHNVTHHQGRGITVAEIRSQGYWIMRLAALVKRLIRSCVICRRLRGQPCEQKMADLPSERVSPSPPFTYCGCDLFGPFIIKSGRKEFKRYGVVFTCLASRAVHLEVVFSLSSDSFLNSFRRLVALRGHVKVMRCDQGTNFVGAANDLLRMGCEVQFNPPAASHCGGVWERMVGSARRVIEGILIEQGTQLDEEGLMTVMAETAAVINSRPLSVQDMNDPDCLEPLTPNHLIQMKSKVIPKPLPPSDRMDLYAMKRWKRVQYLIDLFWSRWRKEILHVSQSRSKWNVTRQNLKVDDIVLIVDEQSHRSHWRLARVVQVKISADGLVRSVTVKLPDQSTIDRPVQKLIYITGK